jgi:hypothetical protein
MGAWHDRPPSQIQMGNGTLLATFDAQGELEQFFAPHIDALGARLGAFRTSAILPSPSGGAEIVRIDSANFQVRLEFEAGCQVLRAEYHHRTRPLKFRRRIGVHPTEPILLDEWRVFDEPAGLLHESIPWFGNATSAHCSLYHPTFNGLVHHRGRRWLGVLARGQTDWVRVGHLSHHDRQRLWSGERIFVPMGSQDLGNFPEGPVRHGWDQVVQGPATWGALALAPSPKLEFIVICGESENHLGNLLALFKHLPAERYFSIIEGQVARRHAPAEPMLSKITSPRARFL